MVSVCVSWSAPAFATGGWFGNVELVVDDEVVEDVVDVVVVDFLLVVDVVVLEVVPAVLVVLAWLVEVLVDDEVVVLLLEDDVVVPDAIVVLVVPVEITTLAVSPAADQVPALSRTQSCNEYVPAAVYTCEVVGTDLVSEPPSPYCHHQVATVPSESVEPEPSNETATFVTPVLSGPAFATGATLGRVVLVDEVELVLVVVGRDVDELELVLVVVGRDVDVDVELVVEVDVELEVEDELLDDVELDVLVVDVVGLPPPPLAAQTGEHASSMNAHAPARRIFPPGRLILRIRPLHTFKSRLRRRATEQGMCRGERSCFPESPCPHHQPHPTFDRPSWPAASTGVYRSRWRGSMRRRS
jgi:hypothetical protein